MGKRGPKPKPAALKLFEGNPGKRRINPEYQPPKAGRDFEAPGWLKGEGLREWTRLVGAMSGCGMLSTIDRNALAAYCGLFGRWTECEWMLRREGLASKSGEVSPWLKLANELRAQMRPYESEFGMTPGARARVAVNPPAMNSQAESLRTSATGESKPATPAPIAGPMAGLIGRVN
jgi:P27 family predicted phage terminase small subunit